MRRGCEKELFLFYYVLLPESATHTAAADFAMSEKSHPFWVTQMHTQTHTFTIRVCDCDTTSEQIDTRFILHLWPLHTPHTSDACTHPRSRTRRLNTHKHA